MSRRSAASASPLGAGAAAAGAAPAGTAAWQCRSRRAGSARTRRGSGSPPPLPRERGSRGLRPHRRPMSPGGEASAVRGRAPPSSTSATCPGTLTLRHAPRTTPCWSSRKVQRSMPMYLRPYMLFSTQTPYFSQTSRARIGGEDERELVLFLEFVVRGDRILRDADHHRAGSAIVRERVAKPAGFGGAARGVVLRIKVQHHLFPLELRQGDAAVAVGGQREIRGFVADLDTHRGVVSCCCAARPRRLVDQAVIPAADLARSAS